MRRAESIDRNDEAKEKGIRAYREQVHQGLRENEFVETDGR